MPCSGYPYQRPHPNALCAWRASWSASAPTPPIRRMTCSAWRAKSRWRGLDTRSSQLTMETLDLDALERLWERIQLPLGNALGPAEEFALSGRALIQRLRWAELDR